MPGSISRLIERHRAFWRCADTGTALVGTSRWPYITTRDFDWGLPVPEGSLEPDMLTVQHFLPQYEARFEARGLLDGDLIWSAVPPRAVPWFEAIVGCEPRYSIPAGSMSGKAFEGDWSGFDPASALADNPWVRKLLEFTEALVELSKGRFPVSPPIGRGPWDIASAVRGTTSIYLDLYDDPVDTARLAAKCAEVWVQVTRQLARIIPPWHGGYVNAVGLWAPEFSILPQDDASVSVSPAMYRRIMSPADRTVAQAWRWTIFHLHSAGLQVADEVAGFLDGRALNIVFDATGPPVADLLPLLLRLQASHVPLHVMVFSPTDLDSITKSLMPKGLAVTYQPVDDAS